jgi:hypothetical protein
MKRRLLTRLLGVFGLLVVGLSGCGVGKLYPVSGKATLDGEAIKEARVSFVADTEKGNKTSATTFGKIVNGEYTLLTNDQPGAPAGWYKVVILTKWPGGPENNIELPRAYSDAGKSPISVEVVANPQAGAYDLTLKVKTK